MLMIADSNIVDNDEQDVDKTKYYGAVDVKKIPRKIKLKDLT